MKVNIAFNNVDHSDALHSFIQQKSDQINKLLWKGEKFSWVIEQDSSDFKSKLNLKLKNKKIYINAKAKNAFIAVNDVIEKAKRIIREDHKKLNNIH